MSVLLFFIVLFVLILVHEWGHFVVAKKTGMRVDEFGIGFPPRLFGIRRGETEYTFNALPIGGFVRICGENLDEKEGAEDFDRSFMSKSKWAQAAVLIAGVAMNVIFAWILLVAVYMVGVPAMVAPGEAGPDARLVVTTVVPDSPAAAANLPVGATITGLASNNRTLETFTPAEFSAFTTAVPDEVLTLTYRVSGEEQTVILTPETEVLDGDADRPAVGVALVLIETRQHNVVSALWQATVYTGTALVAITVGITTLLADALTLTADLSQVAGPVGIVGLVGDAAQFGLTSLLLFTAIISLNLAVINLLPFPALDGGRLLFVAIEAVTRRPINPDWAARLNFVGFVLLILLMVAVTYNDILRLI